MNISTIGIGRLPYRSLEFRFETLNVERHQPVAVINYPNENLYTRVTEFKYLTGQEHPQDVARLRIPEGVRRSVLSDSAQRERGALSQVSDARRGDRGVHFVGRLATYKYYNMDQVVAQALTLYSKITSQSRRDVARTRRLTWPPLNRTYSTRSGWADSKPPRISTAPAGGSICWRRPSTMSRSIMIMRC